MVSSIEPAVLGRTISDPVRLPVRLRAIFSGILMTDDFALPFAIIVLGSAAILLGVAFPQREQSKGWDNSRPATQKDVADVKNYRAPRQSGPRALPLVFLLIVVFGIVIAIGGKVKF